MEDKQPTVLKFAPIAISLLSLFISFSLLPLQESDVTFSQTNIQIISEDSSFGNSLGDSIIPTLTNIGKASAKSIQFSVYALGYGKEGISKVISLYGGKPVQDLDSGESIRFNGVHIPYAELGKPPMTIGEVEIVLIFHIKYVDSLTNGERNKVLMYQYILGKTGTMTVLTYDIYSKLYPSISQYFESSSDLYMKQYIKDHVPS